MEAEQPVILVDDREPENAAERLQAFGLTAVRTRLEAGDYQFFPHGLVTIVERKTISNLLASLSDRQMVGQAHKMIASGDRAFLLREGAFRRDADGHVGYYSPRDPRADKVGWVASGWSWDSFSGMMIDLQLMGIGLIDCPVLGTYPTELARLVINLSKREHRWIKERQRPGVISLDKQYVAAVWAACALEGVGPEWASTFLKHFGTFARFIKMASEDKDAMATVKCSGRAFGKKRALRLQEAVDREWGR